MNTPFDLETSIAVWRTKFCCYEGIGQVQVQELESHLRDSIDTLHQTGLSLEESFLVARHRLGAESVAEEMQRSEPSRLWAARARWMFLGVLSYYALISLTAGVRGIIQIATALLLPTADAARFAALLATGVSVGLIAWILWQVAQGRWQFTTIKTFAALRRPLPLALVAAGVVILGKVIGVVETTTVIRGLGVQSYANLYMTTLQWFGLGEALLIPVVLAFAVDRARQTAEA